MPSHILVDGDACPVKDEIYRVAGRLGVPVTLVANSGFRVPRDRLPDGAPLVTPIVVSDAFDAADDEIVRRAEALAAADVRTVVVTGDIPLAHRVLQIEAGTTAPRPGGAVRPARAVIALKPNGHEWDAANIGGALATRTAMEDLRGSMAGMTGGLGSGPKPFGKEDRSRFLQALDRALTRR